MRRTALACLAFVLPTSGCEEPQPTPVPGLAKGNAAGNARNLSDAVDRLCIYRAHDPNAFEEAVAQIGWRFQKVQEPDERTTLAVWQSPEAELIYSQRPMRVSGGQAWVCSLHARTAFSPTQQSVIDAWTRRLEPPRSDIPDPTTWEWRPTPLQQATLTLDSASDGGLIILVELVESTFGRNP